MDEQLRPLLIDENAPERTREYLDLHPEELTMDDIINGRFTMNNFFLKILNYERYKSSIDGKTHRQQEMGGDYAEVISSKYMDCNDNEFGVCIENALDECGIKDSKELHDMTQKIDRLEKLWAECLRTGSLKRASKLREMLSPLYRKREEFLLPVFKSLRAQGFNSFELSR